MQTTRHKIIDHLGNKKVSTTHDLSQALRVTPANIRYHLSILQDQNQVEIVGEQPLNGRGRPRQLYGLSQKAKGHNLNGLAHALLEKLLDGLTSQQKQDRIVNIAAHLLDGKENTSGNLNQRLLDAIQHLNKLNYHARWEAHADAPRVLFSHCPYNAIIDEHPELCQMDVHLLKSILDTTVQQISKLQKDNRGVRWCVFALGVDKGESPDY